MMSDTPSPHSLVINRQQIAFLIVLMGVSLAVTSFLSFPTDLYVYMALIGLVGIVASNMFSFWATLFTGGLMCLQHVFKVGDLRYIPTAFAFLLLMLGVVWALTYIRKRDFNRYSQLQTELDQERARRMAAESQIDGLQVLMDVLPIGVMVFCFKDGKRLYSNPAALRLFRVHTEDELPAYLRDIPYLTSSDEERVARRVDQYHKEQVTSLPAVEYRLMIYDSVVHVRSQSQMINYNGEKAVVSMLMDITESRKAEKNLRESEERYRVITEMSQAGIAVLNQEDYKVLYSNPAWDRLIGMKHVSTINIAQIIQVQDNLSEYHKLMRQFLRDGVVQAETDIQTMQGKRLRVRLNVAKILFEGRHAALLIVDDITEQHSAQQLKTELEKERQIRALRDGFVAMMSHEFRTPLAIIQSSTDIFDKYSDRLTIERRDYHVQKMRLQIQHMVTMIDDLLLLSRANAGMLEFKPQRVDLGQIVRDIITQFNESRVHDHSISLEVQGNFYDVTVDSDLVRLIMLNLLGNAAKYSPVGTNIRVELMRKGIFAQLTVSDEGIGVPPNTPNLFDAFVRGANVGNIQGTGMGLAIVKTSAHRHGGDAMYHSRPGQTSFIVTLRILPEIS